MSNSFKCFYQPCKNFWLDTQAILLDKKYRVFFFHLDLTCYFSLVSKEIYRIADLWRRWPLRTRQSPTCFLGFWSREIPALRRDNRGVPIPALQWQQRATAMTNSTLHQPWQTVNSISHPFENQKEEEVPYEEGSCSRGTRGAPGRSHRALRGRRGLRAVLPWAHRSTGNISATFCCCFCLGKIKNTPTGQNASVHGHDREKFHTALPKRVFARVRSDTGGQVYHRRFSHRESKNHDPRGGAEKHREPLWGVKHS